MSSESTGFVGMFARANHPAGWGYADGRAHGYVIVFVKCADAEELAKVAARLGRGWDGLAGRLYSDGVLNPNGHEWFGGQFELIGTSEDVFLPKGSHRFDCRGDNRMVASYLASEVLGT